jgi:hypothetical protein
MKSNRQLNKCLFYIVKNKSELNQILDTVYFIFSKESKSYELKYGGQNPDSIFLDTN